MSIEVFKTYSFDGKDLKPKDCYSLAEGLAVYQRTVRKLKELSAQTDAFGFFYQAFLDLVVEYGVQPMRATVSDEQEETIWS